MDWVIVAAGVLELEPVALAVYERRGAGFGIRLAVDHPVIGRAVSGEFRFKDERDVDYVSWIGGRRRGCGKLAVIPEKIFGLLPGGFAGAAGVFDDDSRACGLDVFADLAEDPDAGVVHFDKDADALGWREP